MHGAGRNRAAIVITNKMIDSIIIRQLSDEDTFVTEAVYNKVKTIIGSMYFDINRQIEYYLNKVGAVMQHAKGTGTIIAMDTMPGRQRGTTT